MVGLTILVWIIILMVKGIEVANGWAAIKEIPTVVGWLTPFALWFASTGWRWRIFKGWLVLTPDLNGTWEGDIRSEWIDPHTGQKIPSIKTYLIIKQTLFDIHCCQITQESKSYSRAATIQRSPDGNISVIEFTYSNTPKVSVHYRSRSHDGACTLDVITGRQRKLIGKYWTDRNTKGEIELQFFSKERRQEF